MEHRNSPDKERCIFLWKCFPGEVDSVQRPRILLVSFGTKDFAKMWYTVAGGDSGIPLCLEVLCVCGVVGCRRPSLETPSKEGDGAERSGQNQ